ncbi:hypothetical protein M8C21_030290 [Ambrosia artemisiifolia]|uniref:K Homology domain-containing protein n=1 Tax=Ambrosia artemisiifolia TaxID=4212 RepID=A0AAD5C3L4_AMBAR|nr:hypothetical protein M8C21_030290 [Ambrosia artemisiifolia]
MANQTLKLGGGLRQDGDAICVMKAGKLRFMKPNKYWVESSQKRNFLVDIKGPALAFLPVLSFEGGTRRNIPKFEVGTLLLLSSPPHPVLEGLGKKLSFEIAVGINGRFWVNASQSSTVILVGNAIQKSESLSLVQQKIYLEKLLKSIHFLSSKTSSSPHLSYSGNKTGLRRSSVFVLRVDQRRRTTKFLLRLTSRSDMTEMKQGGEHRFSRKGDGLNSYSDGVGAGFRRRNCASMATSFASFTGFSVLDLEMMFRDQIEVGTVTVTGGSPPIVHDRARACVSVFRPV